MTAVPPILDASQIKEVTDLRQRLTRGGLAPEAVQKAVEAFQAGDVHGLNFADANDYLIVRIPEELLVKVFPQLLESRLDPEAPGFPPDQTSPWFSFLGRGEDRADAPLLEYEINRHRGDRKSLTIRWPGAKSEEGPEPTEPGASTEDGDEPF